MTCDECREQLSARLDGEEDAESRIAVDAHVATCPGCREWLDDAAKVTRLARTSVATPTPDLVPGVLAQQPRVAGGGRRQVLRLLLAAVGLGQLALAAASFLGTADGSHHGSVEGASLRHFANEFAAWNLALGIGFLWIALRHGRSSGVLPILSVFVAVLTVAEVVDVLRGDVAGARVLSHALVQAGFLIVLALRSARFGGGGLFPRNGPLPDTSPEYPAAEPSAPTADSGPAVGTGLRPTAHHHAA